MRALRAACLMIVLCLAHEQQATGRDERGFNQTYLPDLVVLGAALMNAEKGEFNVTVRNGGRSGAPPCQLRLTIMDQDGTQILKITPVEQPPIGPGETARLNIGAQMSLSGQRYILATDALDAVRESNERNNLYRGRVSKY